MRTTRRAEYPPDVERCRRRAVRLEWVTLAYVSSAALLLYVTMGSSQAMRASFFEDLLSLVPSAAFLVSARVARRAPTDRFPYGQHRRTASRTCALAPATS